MLVDLKVVYTELGVSPNHVRREVKRGAWPHYRLGRRVLRFDLDELKSLGRLVSEGKPESSKVEGE